MTREIKLPNLGEEIESGDVVSILVEVGDTIEADQSVIELETDKATLEVPADKGGTVSRIEVAKGDTVKTGQVLLILDGEDEGDESGDEEAQQAEEAGQEQEQDQADASGKEDQAGAEDEKEEKEGQEKEDRDEQESGDEGQGGSGQVVEVKMPEVGEGVEGGDVVSVLVSVGDTIENEQGIAEIETDKATVEVPSDQAGTVKEIHISSGDSVKIGQAMISVETAAGQAAAESKAKPEAKKETARKEEKPKGEAKEDKAEKAAEKETSKRASGEPETDERLRSRLTGDDVVAAPDKLPPRRQESDRPLIPAGPATRRYARQLGVDLTLVEGSGPGGRIQKEDVEQAVRKMSEAMAQKPSKAASAPAQGPRESGAETARADRDKHGPVRREKMTRIRQTIARRMAESKNTIPHVTNFDDADITDLEAFRQEHKNDFEVKLTHMPFVVKAVVNALAQHPVINASLDMEAGEIIYKDYTSVGIAVDTDRGLLVPVLREADELSIAQIARRLQQLAKAARDGDVDLADLRGGTFTISNLGAIGGRYSTPVINLPEVAILLLGRSRREPRVMPDGSIQVRMIMPLSLSYDHRVVDGADAARFLEDLKGYLESPGKLLLTI